MTLKSGLEITMPQPAFSSQMRIPFLAAAFVAIALTPSLKSQVTAYPNTGYAPGSVRERPDGEVLSPFFNVSVNTSSASTALYVYNAQVRSINFPDLNSTFTGESYSASGPNGDNGTFTTNLGTASFASFQLAGAATVVISFPTGYPTSGTITDFSNVKVIDGVLSSHGTITPNPAGYPAGSFSFTVAEKVDASNNGIPQNFTIEINGDWLNSLHIFVNPHPTTANSKPTGAGVFQETPGSAPTWPGGYTAYYFPPGIYPMAAGRNFGNNTELYLDDGAIIKYTGSATDATPMFAMGGSPSGTMLPAIIRGWGILDGQAMQSYLANATNISTGAAAPQTCTAAQQVQAPMCQPTAGTTPGPAANGTLILSLNDEQTSSTEPVLVDGVILRNSAAFNMTINKSKGTSAYPITINNIKIFGFSGATPNEGNSDGVDVFTSQFVNLTSSFIRTEDDLDAVDQSLGSPTTLGPFFSGALNYVGNTYWNEGAHAMVVGGELYNATNPSGSPLAAENITWDSNLVIHDTGKAPLMAVLNYFGGAVQNIFFSNNTMLEEVAAWSIEDQPDATTNPGYMGGSTVCNLTAAAQKTTLPIVGYEGSSIAPFVIPLPNFQEVISLPAGDNYDGGTGSYPRAIQYGPRFFNVTVAGMPVNTTVDGNDFYYMSSDGSSHYSTLGLPQNDVELTVRIRTTGDPYSIFAYNQSQIAGDMYGPQYTTFSCGPSSLLPVPVP